MGTSVNITAFVSYLQVIVIKRLVGPYMCLCHSGMARILNA